jgi:hypothetical protein
MASSSLEQLSALVAGRQWERVHEALSPVDRDACQALDDLDGSATSLDAAAETFATLGAAGDLATVEQLRARHVSDIFAKIGVSSWAGATAYAYRYQLVDS